MDTPAPATIILITGDRDFVYAVSILRLRRYNVVVLAPKLSHEGLRTRASEVIDWDYKVLGKAMPLSLRLRRPLKTVPQDTLTAPSVSTSSTTSPPSRLASTPPVRFSQPTPTRNSKHQSYAVDSNVSPKSGHRCIINDTGNEQIPIDVSSDGISASGTPTNDPRYQTEVTQD
ncbi:hypothetical protein PHLCEN_2v5030 [Hermanssonia centrifuga]|uniref:NYN domain-containing protein n=1 Tax=Hermanssonia centrifuga TaxID=98765 RepID=A0A2R6PCA2_9APHY|nr:hypothetical protein PHLCEN_2v5030 [Hermanssonia centrifuga]